MYSFKPAAAAAADMTRNDLGACPTRRFTKCKFPRPSISSSVFVLYMSALRSTPVTPARTIWVELILPWCKVKGTDKLSEESDAFPEAAFSKITVGGEELSGSRRREEV